MNLQTAYNNFFRRPNMGFPKFKSKHRSKDSYTTNNQKGSVRIESGYIRLPKIGLVKLKSHRSIPDSYLLKSVTLSRTPSNKYYASILFEYESKQEICHGDTFLGLDFSMTELYVSSDGDFANYPRFYRRALEKLAKEQRKLSLCKIGSNNRTKQRIKVARLHEKIANQRKDFLHKHSRKIANSYDVVCIEDLNMQAMSQALNFGKSVSDNGWGMFTTFLSYKLAEQGKQLIKIDKWFPSSKTCSCCGAIKETLKLSERTYNCDHCGFSCDRDINASINIREQGKLLLS